MHWRKARNRAMVEVDMPLLTPTEYEELELRDIKMDLPNFHVPFYIKVEEMNIYNILVGKEQRIFCKMKNKEFYCFSIVDGQVMINENLGDLGSTSIKQVVSLVKAIRDGIKKYDINYLNKYRDAKRAEYKRDNEKIGLPSFVFGTVEDYDTLMTRDLDSYMLKSQYMPFSIFTVERTLKYALEEGYVECPRLETITRLPDDTDEIQNTLVDYGVSDLFEDISYQKYKNGVLIFTRPQILGSDEFTMVLLNERFSEGLLRPSSHPERDQAVISDLSIFCKRFTDALSMGRRDKNPNALSKTPSTSKATPDNPSKDEAVSVDKEKKSIIYLKEYTKSKKTKYSRGTSRKKSGDSSGFHLVRGHMRFYKSGKVVFIKSYQRGNAASGGTRTSRHEYVIKF